MKWLYRAVALGWLGMGFLWLHEQHWGATLACWSAALANALLGIPKLGQRPANAGVKCTHCNGFGYTEPVYDPEHGWTDAAPCDTCETTGRITTVEQYLKTLPANWHHDSSLETWFPITAKELNRLWDERAAQPPPASPTREELLRFVEGIACYDRYTHDGIDELDVLKDIENEAKKLWKPDGDTVTKSACTCPPGWCCEKEGAAASDIRECRQAGETNEAPMSAEERSFYERGKDITGCDI